MRIGLLTAFLNVFAMVASADAPQGDLSWTPLFNGADLSGWVNVNTAPGTWSVRDGMIVCTGLPRGFLRTERVFENYVLELEWRHVHRGGNAGVMVHADPLPQVGAPYPESVEVQVMDGDGGSMFVTASWSTWSYRLKDRPEAAREGCARVRGRDSPGNGRAGRDG